MIDHQVLAQRLTHAATVLNRDGGLTWERCQDWTPPGRMPARGERGGGMADGAADDRIDDRREDAAAGRYHAELSALTRRLEADTARLERIVAICCPVPAKNLQSRDMLAAQVAADGWCVNCWKDNQHLEPISKVKSRNGDMVPRYKDRCRKCGDWKAEHGQEPPLSILQLWHDNRRVTTAIADKALGRA